MQIYQYIFNMPSDTYILVGFVDNIIETINQLTITYDIEVYKNYEDMVLDVEILLDQIKPL